jgi:hypothetical protein
MTEVLKLSESKSRRLQVRITPMPRPYRLVVDYAHI